MQHITHSVPLGQVHNVWHICEMCHTLYHMITSSAAEGGGIENSCLLQAELDFVIRLG
jgi:hypothetical protein